MMIKLTPEHVGTRVLLSDGAVGLVTRFNGDPGVYVSSNRHLYRENVTVSGENWTDDFDLEGFHLENGDDPHFYRIALLLDAPNPLEVPVPEWCWWIYVHRSEFSSAPPVLVHRGVWDELLQRPEFTNDVIGWSVGNNQLPPKNNEDEEE